MVSTKEDVVRKPSRFHIGNRRALVASLVGLSLIAVPAVTRGASSFQKGSFTQVSGSPNPQYHAQSLAIMGDECLGADSVAIRPTGSITFFDTTRNKTLGRRPLQIGPSVDCGRATLTISTLSVGKHEIEAKYRPGGKNPVDSSDPAFYEQIILPGGKGHRHFTFKGGGVLATTMKGGQFYEHGPPLATDHDQVGLFHIPKGKLRLRKMSRGISIKDLGSPGAGPRRNANIALFHNTANAVPTSNSPVDPSEASKGNVVVYATNEYIAFSVNGGSSFTALNPASMYSDAPDGGVCCDQIVQYIPQIDRFAWLDQYWAGPSGTNRYRLAVFPPSAVTASGPAFWTYWDITAASFPALTLPFLDFPDLAVGNNYLYLSANNGADGGVSASVIARIGLQNLLHGLNLADGTYGQAWRYIAGHLFLGRVAQNTGSRAFWAYNNSTSSIQVSYWDESSTSWFGPFNIGDYTWPNSNFAATTPDGRQWVYTYGGQVLAGTRTGRNDVWFGWTAGIGSGRLSWLSQVHIELADINVGSMTLRGQRPIWNPAHAFAYPNLNTSENGHLGVALAWGGNCCWDNFAVGDLTLSPFLVWNMTSSNANCACGRWGDYVAIRPGYNQNPDQQQSTGFTAAGYGVNSVVGQAGAVYDPHFVSFSVSP
jgi:hypothetical protein